MPILPPAKLLSIYLDETDRWNEQPLYEAIVSRLLQLDIEGATVQQGIAGYGAARRFHRKGLFGMSDDRPVVITIVDNEAKLRAVLPQILPMLQDGLATLADVEVAHPAGTADNATGEAASE